MIEMFSTASILEELVPRLRSHVEGGRIGVARPLLNAILRLASVSAEVSELEVRLLMLEGRDAMARSVLDVAIEASPSSPELRLRRAFIRSQMADFAGAAADAADAVILRPKLTIAKTVLGRMLILLNHYDDAVTCLREAAAIETGNHVTWLLLAYALDLSGDGAGACAVLDAAIARDPHRVELRKTAILLRLSRREFVAAEAIAEASRRAGVADACVFGLLGHARSSLGRHDDAAEAYFEARKLAPDDPYVRHLTASAGLSADVGRASADYVRVLFDGYATRFDSHLMALGYRVPGLLRRELEQNYVRESVLTSILDLGCGTGLVAVALSGLLLGAIVGVDLSAEMLAIAAGRNLYDELHHQDIEQFLFSETRQFSLILAADVMPYFGDLEPLIQLIAKKLSYKGRVIFSVECMGADEQSSPGWVLGRLGRYLHSERHVRAAAGAAGLQVGFIRDESLRREGSAEVPGLFVGLMKANS